MKILLTVATVSLAALATACAENVLLLDKPALTGARDSFQTFSFVVPSSIPKGTIQISTASGGTGRVDINALRLKGVANHKVVIDWNGNTGVVYGFIPGQWEITVGGVSFYRGINVTVQGERSSQTQLTDIPYIMEANGWNKGAALMNKWLNSTAGNYVDRDSIITLDWALGFQQAKSFYDQIYNSYVVVYPAVGGAGPGGGFQQS